MKVINLNLAYKVAPGDRLNFPSNKLVTEFLFRTAANFKWPQSMPRDSALIWGKIQDKLRDAAESEAAIIELDDTEFRFVHDMVAKTDLPANLSSWKFCLEDYLDRLKSGSKETGD